MSGFFGKNFEIYGWRALCKNRVLWVIYLCLVQLCRYWSKLPYNSDHNKHYTLGSSSTSLVFTAQALVPIPQCPAADRWWKIHHKFCPILELGLPSKVPCTPRPNLHWPGCFLSHSHTPLCDVISHKIHPLLCHLGNDPHWTTCTVPAKAKSSSSHFLTLSVEDWCSLVKKKKEKKKK